MTSSQRALSGRDSIWTGRRVRLRAMEPDEWPKFREFDLNSADQRNADQVLVPRSIPGYQEWAKEKAAVKVSDDVFWLVIADLETNRPVGYITTYHTDLVTGVYSYGVVVFREEQRRGYAGEAIRIVQRYMFGERRYLKCQANVHGDNGPSLGLHQSLGFVTEGRLRKAVFHEGTHQDMVIFGMTVDEFRNLR